MPFRQDDEIHGCPICEAPANIREVRGVVATVVDCAACGDYAIEDWSIIADVTLPIARPERRALARYLIRQMNGALLLNAPRRRRALLTDEVFHSLNVRSLPSPAAASDNLLLLLAKRCGSKPGTRLRIDFDDLGLAASVGAIDGEDVSWLTRNIAVLDYFEGEIADDLAIGFLSGSGWRQVAELRRSETSSQFAFFARKFRNADLDKVYNECLIDAVRETGFELRTVTQKAGLIDAIIEDEIRRCSFVLADLSDDNAGAYWEAGFAEGLGKPVIYICRAQRKKTHFDANHRQTVRWDLGSFADTARELKAVIRNTLLGRATQSDTEI